MHYVIKRNQKWHRNAFQTNCFRLTLNAHLIRNNSFQDKISFLSEFHLNPKTHFRKQYINGKIGN